MKKMKNKDASNQHKCNWCETLAKWRNGHRIACDNHKVNLERLSNDNHISEADYQTWSRF